jgi:pimeloyl-ACP methyl ester carboxylesterase
MPFARSDDVGIYYEDHGDGPALLLVPVPAISSDWFPFADRLEERFHVVVYDNRGSGRSDGRRAPTRPPNSRATRSRYSTCSRSSAHTSSASRWAG